MEDQVILMFDNGLDMMSFLEIARVATGTTSDEEIKIVVPRLAGGSRLGAASSSSFEVIVFAVNVLSATGTLIGLYLNRFGRKNITIVHTRTEKRVSISGLTGPEAAAVLKAAASDVVMLDTEFGDAPAALESGGPEK
jgi:hypothetical protein